MTPMSLIILPDRISYDDVDFSWMIGRSIAEVSILGPTVWRFAFGSGEAISVECLWRIVRNGRVVRCSGDHGQQFGLPAPVDAAVEATALLSASPIVAMQLRDATADLSLDFGTELRLEIIPDSSGYESWQVYGPAGACFVAQGGGQICKWIQ